MQSKNAIRLVAILLAIACLWQLSFTLVTRIQEGKAAKYAEKAVEAYQNSAAFANILEEDKAFVLDSIRRDNNRWYIDSISAEKVYFGYTYKDVKEREINLGLDLKGGMNVMLQVQLEDLVKALSDNNQTPEFTNALALAKERSVESRGDFITLFAEAWNEVGNGIPLAQIFGTYEMNSKINSTTSDAEVISVIREEAESAIANSFNVLRNRIDRFGVTQPNIQQLGNSGRILIELPGVKEPERVRKLLQGTASLEFWATYENSEIYPFLEQANSTLAELLAEGDSTAVAPAAESTAGSEGTGAADDILSEEISAAGNETADDEAFKKANPLFAALQPAVYNGRLATGACIGYASYADTAKINTWLHSPQIQALFPAEFKAMWTVKPSQAFAGGNMYELVAIRSTSRDGKAPLDGGVVTDARVQYGNSGGSPEVSMSMNAEGANIWARMTKDNIGRQIAIVLDGMVYSYPVVNTEITGGSSSITGNFDLEEAEDLANVLKSGKLPVLCAFKPDADHGLAVDGGDFHLRVRLAVTHLAFLVFLGLIGEHGHLSALAGLEDLRGHACARNIRLAGLEAVVRGHGDHLVKGDLGIRFGGQLFDVNHVAGLDPVLLPAGLDHCVHVFTLLS